MTNHKIEVPEDAGRGLTQWIAHCPACGAMWDCYYTNEGLVWKPKNAAAESCPAKKD